MALSEGYDLQRDTVGAERSLKRAVDHLRSLQSPEGWWKGKLETNVTMDAEDLMLRQFLGILDRQEATAAAKWIRTQQRDDGTWATFYGGPGDLSTTVEAYVALRIAGDAPSEAHMEKAAQFVCDEGGLEQSRVFTRIWLSLFGLWSWEDLPALPPEVIFLPPTVPLNIYEFGCWARQTLVALSVVAAYRPVHPLDFGVEELRTGACHESPKATMRDWKGRFVYLDRALHRYERIVRRGLLHDTLREWALGRAERWIVRRQEADGSWGGIQPPWVYSILALHLRGYPNDHPNMARAFEGLEKFLVREDGARWLEACQSPVWDTALSVIALADAGVPGDDDSMVRAASWLLEAEIDVRGDWQIRRPELQPGGWAFEFANCNYPDVDDTAEVVLALRKVHHHDLVAVDAAVDRAITWTEAMVSKDGGWGAFDADNVREVLYELPLSDFGVMIDPPSADVTAHTIEMLAHESGADRGRIDQAIAWLRTEQESDGAWFGRWGVNYIYGIGAVVPALIAAGMSPEDPTIKRAIAFLYAHQNDDGGWGEDIRSYDDPNLRASGATTASQTAWALLAVVAAGEQHSDNAWRGVEWLVETQLSDGNWDEPWYTGTGFPGDFYINYHLYRLIFPVTALGRWLRAIGEGEATRATRPPAQRRAQATREQAMTLAPLFLVPLRAEVLAVRFGAPRASVRRIGMGPARATAARSVLANSEQDDRPIVLVGLCGGLIPGLGAGDVVVASSVSTTSADKTIVLSGAGAVSALLDEHGINSRVEPIISSSKILHGDENRRLASSDGAVAVDMESYWRASLAEKRPFAVVRVVIDTLGRRILSPHLVQSCFRSFRSLSRVARVLSVGLPTDVFSHLVQETGEK